MAPKRFSLGLVSICLSIILPCLVLSSVLELALKNAAPKRPGNWDERTQSLSKRAAVSVVWWPQKMFPNEEGLLNASAAVALLTAFALSVFGIYALKKGPTGTHKTRLVVLVVLALDFVLATAAFLFSFVQSRLSARIDMDYLKKLYKEAFDDGNLLYDKGTFTSEIWSCGIDEVIVDGFDGEMNKACAMHLGARWLTFTTFLFSAALFGVIFMDSHREGHILNSSKSSYAA